MPEVPTDLAAMIEDDDKELAAMIETHAARIEEEKERIQTRKRQAREVAEAAPCGAQPRGGDEEDGDEDGDRDGEDVAGCRDQNDPDDYYLIPSEYLASFCDEPANPAPVDTTPLLCVHGLADPGKATSAKRITPSRVAGDHRRRGLEGWVRSAARAGGNMRPVPLLLGAIRRRLQGGSG